MNGDLLRYSLLISPRADLASHYSAEFCATELNRGVLSEHKWRRYTRPTEIGDLLTRLGSHREDILAALASFGHDQTAALTLDLDPYALQGEGFEPV